MDRKTHVLATLAAAGRGASLPPAQVQKLFFLIDREIPDAVGGPHFNFAPYDYGPFDSAVYDVLDELERVGSVYVDHSGRYRRYALTENGFKAGEVILRDIKQEAATFLREAASWVSRLSFSQLVSAIYKHYPEMKERSIFRG